MRKPEEFFNVPPHNVSKSDLKDLFTTFLRAQNSGPKSLCAARNDAHLHFNNKYSVLVEYVNIIVFSFIRSVHGTVERPSSRYRKGPRERIDSRRETERDELFHQMQLSRNCFTNHHLLGFVIIVANLGG